MIDCSSGDAFGVLTCQFYNSVLQCGVRPPIHTINYRIVSDNSVLQCGVRLPIHTLNYSLVSGACFLAGGVLNCNLSHCRSVAVLCMLYKIRCNPIHPLCGTLPVPYVPVRVTRDALIAYQYTYAPPRCRTSQYHRTFIPLSVSLWNDLVDPLFNGVGLAGFKSRSNAFWLA